MRRLIHSLLLCSSPAVGCRPAGHTPHRGRLVPNYRGPTRSGIVDEQGLLADWSDSAPAELWRREIGAGFSAVSIADGRLFTMEAVDLQRQ